MTDRPVKWRWALYGLIAGVGVCVAAFVLEGSDYQPLPWLRADTVRSAGISGTLLVFGIVGFVAGFIRDRMAS